MATDAGENNGFLQISREIHKLPCIMPKGKKKKEKVHDKMLLRSVFPGWPYCVTYPSLLNLVLCILHWTHPLPILFHLLSPCGLLLSLSYFYIPGHKNAALTEHHTLQMVHLLLCRNRGTSGVKPPCSLLWEKYTGPFFSSRKGQT